MISDEATLMIAVAALYLYDSMLMLKTNEAVLVRVRTGRWLAGFGSSSYRLAGKEPYLPNPCTPHRRIYRLTWSPEAEVEETPDPGIMLLDAKGPLDHLGWFLCPMMVALFVLLPFGLFSRLGFICIMAAASLFYVSAIGLVVTVYVNRKKLGITSRQVASVGVQCLACPPFAINFVRKICAVRRTVVDLPAAGRQVLRADQMEEVNTQCLQRLEEQIDLEPEGTVRFVAMEKARARFQHKGEPA